MCIKPCFNVRDSLCIRRFYVTSWIECIRLRRS
nr:MAG TPA: hypothetical protein [Caudoviricetes sp.]